MNGNLSAYLRRYIKISEDEDRIFQSFLISKTFAKKQYLLEEGQTCKCRYYIKKGIVRMFYIDAKGIDQIMHFAIENWWISDYDSLINQEPSKFYIQALENTEVLQLEEADFENLVSEVPQTERLFRKIIENTYIAFQKRLAYKRNLSGEDFFETFVNANPLFTRRVPQYMLASYLGFTPEFVSKIRGLKK